MTKQKLRNKVEHEFREVIRGKAPDLDTAGDIADLLNTYTEEEKTYFMILLTSAMHPHNVILRSINNKQNEC